jgi:lipid-A-disaccharide synthase
MPLIGSTCNPSLAGGVPACVLIAAGEASGDSHGAKLVTAMRARASGIFFCGIGGPCMAAAGVRLVVDAAALAVVGITEAIVKLPRLLRYQAQARSLIRILKPDLVVLIDFPDFNLALAAQAHRHHLPVLYYISPQVWAWRAGRIHKIKRLVDHMALILPFELDFYRSHGVPATFVGHPLLDGPEPVPPLPAPRAPTARPVIGLLPGSRDKEVSRLLPLMLAAASRLARLVPGVRYLVSEAPSLAPGQVDQICRNMGVGIDMERVSNEVQAVFDRCQLVVAASGTVTLEAALAAVPMVIVYKVSRLSYWVGKAMVKVDSIGLPNLIAGRRIVPELIQDQANPETIAETIHRLLTDPDNLIRMRQDLAETARRLGGPGASERTADLALHMLTAQTLKRTTET